MGKAQNNVVQCCRKKNVLKCSEFRVKFRKGHIECTQRVADLAADRILSMKPTGTTNPYNCGEKKKVEEVQPQTKSKLKFLAEGSKEGGNEFEKTVGVTLLFQKESHNLVISSVFEN